MLFWGTISQTMDNLQKEVRYFLIALESFGYNVKSLCKNFRNLENEENYEIIHSIIYQCKRSYSTRFCGEQELLERIKSFKETVYKKEDIDNIQETDLANLTLLIYDTMKNNYETFFKNHNVRVLRYGGDFNNILFAIYDFKDHRQLKNVSLKDEIKKYLNNKN